MKSFSQYLKEGKEKRAVIAWGRMNPPTTGHEKLINFVEKSASRLNADALIFMTQTQDKKKNPLSFDQKLKFAKAGFPRTKFNQDKKVRTIFDALFVLQELGYTDVILVAGSDRVPEYTKMVKPYINTDHPKAMKFNSFKVESAGERDPDAEGASGMSASKMRGFVVDDDFESFAKGTPRKMNPATVKKMFAALKSVLN